MTRKTVVTIGNFDGLHLGHQAILARAREIATSEGLTLVGMTFDPHPLSQLQPGREPARLMGSARKIVGLHKAGADDVIVLEPMPRLLNMTSEEFVDWLVQHHKPALVVEGPDFRFGRDRAGDITILRRLGQLKNFRVIQVQQKLVALTDMLLVPVSSTLVRWLLGQGRVADVSICLGRPYSLEAEVEVGRRRGRDLGVPTANLSKEPLITHAIPANGVYAGNVEIADGSQFSAAVSVGNKPTFGEQRRTVEAHLIDYDGDLYGQHLVVRFSRWLRDQQQFPAVSALKEQLHRDVDQVRRLARWNLDPMSTPLST